MGKAENTENFLVHIPSTLSGLYAWEGALEGNTKDEAERDLRKKCVRQEMTAKTHRLLYGKDYGLGDSLRVEINKGSCRRSLTKKITGVRLWYENNDIGEEPIMEEESQ